MATRRDIYDQLAELFVYPGAEYRRGLQDCLEVVGSDHPQAAEHIAKFIALVADVDRNGIEELFTRTFDLNPECCPELGWHLFGERYERGSFLVWMRSQLRLYDIDEGTELPDHLMYAMRVLARMEDEVADRFATEAIISAIDRMLASVEGKKNPYENLLQAVQEVLVSHHGPAKVKAGPLIQMGNPDGSLVNGGSKG
jgi:nitrate reductase delta subunit